MEETIITYATPVFFLLIGIELLVGWRTRRRTYRVSDAINSIALGILSQITGVFTRVLRIGIYAWCLTHFALFTLPTKSLWVWVTGLLLYDLCYYWLHRMGHEVNILWAAHVVHHQSEDYNLSTALRQTSSGALFGWVFYLPMAILGFPLALFATVALIDLLYQFWIHTELIDRLGWFDRVFASPSNHRVHHAVNDRYVDKNYGGILIVWDRLFGTFEPERDDDRPIYGTRTPLRSWNPVWANVEVYWGTLKEAWYAERWRDRVWIWFARPGWRSAPMQARKPATQFDIGRERFYPRVAIRVTLYCLAQFALLLVMAVHFLDMQKTAPLADVAAYCLYMIVSLTILGALLEGSQLAAALDGIRLVGSAVVPIATERWFGVPHLGAEPGLALFVIFMGSFAALFWCMRSSGSTLLGPSEPTSV